MLPSTIERVPRHTASDVNERIRRQTLRSIEHYRHAPKHEVRRRLTELEREWDIERTLEANAASIALTGLVLGVFADRRFLVIPGIVCAFLLQHALQGWCPPLPVFRRYGFRTQPEIDEERFALRALLEEGSPR